MRMHARAAIPRSEHADAHAAGGVATLLGTGLLTVSLWVLGLALLLGVGAAPARAAACPNDAIRAEQGSEDLPHCRAFEQVSPVDKNNGDVAITASRARSALAGGAVSFISTAAFAGAEGTGSVVDYLARRGPQGWQTEALTPPQDTNEVSLLFKPSMLSFTEDLSASIFRGAAPSPVPGAPAGTFNLFVRHNPGGTFDLATPAAPPGADFFYSPVLAGSSADASRVIFESSGALTPDAPEDGLTKLYESEAGTLRLVGVITDPAECAPASAPCPSPGGSIAGPGATGGRAYTGSSISADGSTVFFTAEPTVTAGDGRLGGRLYARVDATTTLPVSRSQRTDCADGAPCTGAPEPDPAGAKPATFQLATPDGSRVLFVSTEQLVDADANATNDLYQYDLDDETLTLISRPTEPSLGPGGMAEGVSGASVDGTHVYFVTESRLTSEAPAAGEPKLYLWQEGQLEFIAELTSSSLERDKNWSLDYTFGDEARVTATGRYLLFSSQANLVGYVSAGFEQLYEYDAVTDQLRCVSCRPGSGPATATATLSQYPTASVAANRSEYNSRALMEDGRVFFATAERLGANDTNGKVDVYGFDPLTGAQELLSSGQGSSNAYFLDADASGQDVFMVTRDRLVGWDRDNNLDVYSARVGGGFPEPASAPPPCLADACQLPPSAAPAAGPTASTTLVGPGNRSDARNRRCRGQRGKAKAGAPKRCKGQVRKKHRRHNRGAERGGQGR